MNRIRVRPGRRTRLGAAVTAIALALGGCGLGSGENPGAASGPAELSGELKGTITFQTLQLKPTFTDYINGVIARFEEAHPGTEINWVDIPFQGAQEKLTTDATAGTLPDVVNLNPNFAQPLEQKKLFLDLAKVAGDVKDDYVPGAWDAFKVPGADGAYGFPWYLTSEVTMYNADLFAKAGLDRDKPPTTVQELEQYAVKLAAAGRGQFYGLHPALENSFVTTLAKLGVPLLNEQGTKWTFNTPEAVRYVEQLKALYDAKAVPADSLTQDHSKEIEAYQAGKIALFPSGPNFLTIVKENAPKVAAVTKVGPQITGPGGTPNMSVMGLLVPAASKYQKLAVEFAKFITNAENQLAFAKIVTILPSTTASLKDPYFTDTSDGSVESQARKISAEQIAKARNLVPLQFDDRVKKVVIGKVQLAMQGKLSAKDALDQAVDESNQILANNG
ncbi:ABC transporter substrate-binding protein [Kribbella italica]|uniref:Multiple sugar transport system substrate-binding protein n=1 Tax=Kribbella italica TaxID=1540520 RepID=A0A7W9J1S4_9ACTN|nr:sugar ABC transporter substrate-binding protein [Kribbella italica]MBB5833308.1 multiple sugar transport system substrate-binding protein [Kribbella italica]